VITNATRRGFIKTAGAAAGTAFLPRLAAGQASRTTPKLVLIAGERSHGYMAHEHYAGFVLIKKWLEASGIGLQAVVCKNGWPQDESVFDGATALAVNSDGEGRHPLNGHLEKLDELRKRGVGLALLHFALIINKGPLADRALAWCGGYDEAHWSVVKWWKAEFKTLPVHPVTRGVTPFAFYDEWYFHMRFRPETAGITPLLSAVPPDEVREGKDGPHSGNPVVRSRKGAIEHVAWASECPDGTRGFGFTGLHNHWYLGHPQFRKVLLNGLAWCAGAEIPKNGIESPQPTLDELKRNQDKPVPPNFDFGKIQKELNRWKEPTQTSETRG
jgi:hypothetical protein